MRRIRHLWLVSFAADIFAIAAAYYSTLFARFHSEWGEQIFTAINRILEVRETGALGARLELFYTINAPRIILFLCLTVCTLYALWGLYPGRRFIRKHPIAWSVIVSNVTALALFYAYFYLRRNVFHPRSFFATVLSLNVMYCVLFRAMANTLLQIVRRRFGIDECRAILVGSGDEAAFLKALLAERHPHGIVVVDCIPYPEAAPFAALLPQIDQHAASQSANMIVVAEPSLTVGQIMQILALAERLGASTKILSNELEVVVARANIQTDTIQGMPLIHFDPPPQQALLYRTRRVLAVVFCAALLVGLLPLLALIALLIIATSRGAPLFIQERIGVNRKPFRILKFRTMHSRAEDLQSQVEEFNESGQGLFKIRRDPRITPIGRFLRRFSLDELPQFINVIKGDMALVGPRPLPRRDFENYYEEWHYSRHAGMPGLTCLWQVSGRSEINFHNMCILDVYYLCNQTWVLDLRIILRTVYVVLFGKGAY